MRSWLRPVALVLALLTAPGVAEAAENLVHVVTDGTLAHSAHDDEHEHDDGEHGCTATFHACGCCAVGVPCVLPAPAAQALANEIAVDAPRTSTTPDLHPHEVVDFLLRPPIR